MNYRAKLHELLKLCSDNNDEASKLVLLDRITHSADYHTIQNTTALKEVSDKYYSLSALESLSVNELKQRESLLYETAAVCDILRKCIHYGNGPELTEKDKPDFSSLDSIIELKNKIILSKMQKNYSNIRDGDELSLFSKEAVKNAQDCFDRLPVSISMSGVIEEKDLTECMKDTLYCVDIAQFDSIRQSFMTFVQNSEKIVNRERIRRKKHFLFKLATVMICFGSIFSFTQFDLISETYSTNLSAMMLIASFLYMIVG